MYCPNCASDVHSDVKFCTRCGLNLSAISEVLGGKFIELSQSEVMIGLADKCHNGYLSTVVGLGLVIISMLITIAAIWFDVALAAICGLIFLGWAIPAIAQGAGKWISARRAMQSMLNRGWEPEGEKRSERSFPSMAGADAPGFGGSVTEGTTSSLEGTS